MVVIIMIVVNLLCLLRIKWYIVFIHYDEDIFEHSSVTISANLYTPNTNIDPSGLPIWGIVLIAVFPTLVIIIVITAVIIAIKRKRQSELISMQYQDQNLPIESSLTQQIQQSSLPSPLSSENVIYCSKCGSPNSDTGIFCSQCGTKLMRPE